MSEVQPTQGRRRVRWLPVVIIAVLSGAIVAGVTGWLGSRGGTPGPARSDSVQVDVFYLGGTAEQGWLYPERHTVVGDGGQLEIAVNEALGTPLDPDYATGFPEGTSATVTVTRTGTGSTVDIDLAGTAIEADPAAPAGHDGALALQSLVHTVAVNSKQDMEVSFLVAGEAPPVLLGEKLDGPVARASDDSVLSPVRLSLDEGALLRDGATVSGTAAAFEGTVVWQITGRNSDTVIEQGHTMTEECCRPMPFSITLPSLPAGTYVLQVAETDPSGGEGRPPATDSKTFTLG